MIDPLRGLDVLTPDHVDRVSKYWWILVLYGLVSVVVGLLILSYDWTVGSLATFVGFFLILEGVFTASTPAFGPMRYWLYALGVVGIVMGIATLVWPDRTLFILAELIGAWVTVKGLFNIITAVASRSVVHYWWIALVLGVVQVPIGMWLMRRPGLTLYLIIVLAGIWAVAQGTLLVALGFEIKHFPGVLARLAGRGDRSSGTTAGTTAAPLSR